MKTVIKGRVFVYLLLILIVIWQLYIGFCTLTPDTQDIIETIIIGIVAAAYIILRVYLFIENYECYSYERAQFGKSFMACGIPTLEDCDNNYIKYWISLILSFMPIYFLAYIVRIILVFPIACWSVILERADDYLTIKTKSNEN